MSISTLTIDDTNLQNGAVNDPEPPNPDSLCLSREEARGCTVSLRATAVYQYVTKEK